MIAFPASLFSHSAKKLIYAGNMGVFWDPVMLPHKNNKRSCPIPMLTPHPFRIQPFAFFISISLEPIM